MRLINVHSLSMKEFFDQDIPHYVILSHRWQDEEITFKDYERDQGKAKSSYHKIEKLCALARTDNVEWVWIDTCCIDKRDLTELSEAINSMYRWYQKAQYCIAYLFDVEDDGETFDSSKWFERCWTLQELIAPKEVFFYDKHWRIIGRKTDMRQRLSAITRIDGETLAGADPRRCSTAQRMSWAAARKASRPEDQAYSLLGLFDISMPLLYGDGQRAFMNLQERIVQTSDDQSIFAWEDKLEHPSADHTTTYGLLASSPAAFANCGSIIVIPRSIDDSKHDFQYTKVGIRLILPTRPSPMMHAYEVALDCYSSEAPKTSQFRTTIHLRRLQAEDEYGRFVPRYDRGDIDESWRSNDRIELLRSMHVRRSPCHAPIRMFYGFRIKRVAFPYCSKAEVLKTCKLSHGIDPDSSLGSMPRDIALHYRKVLRRFTLDPPRKASAYSIKALRKMEFGFDHDFQPYCIIKHHGLFLSLCLPLTDPENGLNTYLMDINAPELRRLLPSKDIHNQRIRTAFSSLLTVYSRSKKWENYHQQHGMRRYTIVKTVDSKKTQIILEDHGLSITFEAVPYKKKPLSQKLIWTISLNQVDTKTWWDPVDILRRAIRHVPVAHMLSKPLRCPVNWFLRCFYYKPLRMIQAIPSMFFVLFWVVVGLSVITLVCMIPTALVMAICSVIQIKQLARTLHNHINGTVSLTAEF